MPKLKSEQLKALAAIKAARELISDPAKWTKGAYARDQQGRSLPRTGYRHAVCYCSQGAVLASTVEGPELQSHSELSREVYLKGGKVRAHIAAFAELDKGTDEGIVNLNDNPETAHADVLAHFDATIARLEKETA